MKIAAYVRVSTRRQKHDAQKAEITGWLERNGIDMSRVVWYEDKETGKTLKRPAFEQLQRDIFDGKVKTVICWKLDRLARRLRDGINLLAYRAATPPSTMGQIESPPIRRRKPLFFRQPIHQNKGTQ